jgi:NTE family protein
VGVLFVVILAAAGAGRSAGASDMRGAAMERPKIGLALSGGGARGAAHLGVLQVLEELHVPVDYIAGTSMGSIIGGLYAAGLSIGEIESTLTETDWDSVFDDSPPRPDRSFQHKRDDDKFLVKAKPGFKDGALRIPSGAIQGQKFEAILKRLTLPVVAIEEFDDLPIPFRAVATDISTGDAVVLSRGELSRAIRASLSIPGLFAPIEIDGRLLVDGGVAANLPISVVREMGADVVIAVDISTPLKSKESLGSALAILDQLTGILTRRNTEAEIKTLTANDVLIVPQLAGISTADFSRAWQAVPMGKSAAEEHRTELARLGVASSEYELASEKRAGTPRAPVIDFIEIDNNSPLRDEVIRSYIDIETGVPLDVDRLQANLDRIYGLEYFRSVRYDVVTREERTGVRIHADAKPWGPNYLQFGVALAGNLQGDNSFNFGVSYLRTGINDLGAEWRTTLTLGEEPSLLSEWYQPFGVDRRYFFAPRLLYEWQNVDRYDSDGNAVSRSRVRRYGLELAVGREFGTWGEARAGWRRLAGSFETEIGEVDEPSMDFDSGEFFVRLFADKLDDFYFPRHGYLARGEYVISRDVLGADTDFEQLHTRATLANTWGKNTFIALGRFSSTVGGEAPVQSRVRGGGFLNLSGLQQNQLSGQHYAQFGAVWYRRIGNLAVLPAYLGASLEIGNAFEKREDIALDNMLTAQSVFLGLDTFVGPLYFGFGRVEGGERTGYLFLGRPY